MDAINVITIISIILFARLGVRLVIGYKKHKKEKDNDSFS